MKSCNSISFEFMEEVLSSDIGGVSTMYPLDQGENEFMLFVVNKCLA